MSAPIDQLPLARTWLDDVVDALLRQPDGIAHVETITHHLMRTDREVGSAPSETITRTINNYCRDANDFCRSPSHILFQRVAPGTYKLLSWPHRPNLRDIQDVKFKQAAYKQTWDDFRSAFQKAGKGAQWEKATNTKRLEAFARAVAHGGSFHSILQMHIENENSEDIEINLEI